MAKKDYTNWDRNDLIKEVEQLQKRKKYGLVWEDKPEDVVEQCKKKLPILEEVTNNQINTDPDKPTNLLIEGDNYHALSVLNYTHKGKIDIIYIDPPYNTGAKDWKYNNDYVDKNDQWRHSKWLSFMHNRLKITRKLLKQDSILIITIDEHEVHNLGVLLHNIFPTAYIQMVTIVINPKGVTQGRFSRVEEHAFFCFFGNSSVVSIGDDLLSPVSDEEDIPGKKPRWKGLLRSGTSAKREDRKNMFYPVLIDESKGIIIDAGESLSYPKKPNLTAKINGLSTAWPIRTDGTYGRWSVGNITLRKLIQKGYISLGRYDLKRKTWGISYLSSHLQGQIEAGILKVTNYDKSKKVVEVRYTEFAERAIKTVWHRTAHDAGAYGTDYIKKILGPNSFQFPKSINSVIDCLAVVSKNKPKAIILDYFAGSGTTGQAVLELNKKYGGERKFILCTNNENKIAEDVCLPRLSRVMKGYKELNKKTIDGLGGNLKYYKTSFISADPTDKNKIRLTKKATEMLCIKEDTFEEVVSVDKYKIFRNKKHHTGIIFDHLAIDEFKKAIKAIHGKFSVYIFSLGDDTFDEEFEDIKNKVKLSPIPEAILRVYRRIFK